MKTTELNKPTPSAMWTYLIMINIRNNIAPRGFKKDKVAGEVVLGRVVTREQVQKAINSAGSIKNLMIQKYINKINNQINHLKKEVLFEKQHLDGLMFFQFKKKRLSKFFIECFEQRIKECEFCINVITLTEPDKHEPK